MKDQFSLEELYTEPNLRTNLIKEKYNAAKERGYYRTIDLFSGCGGITLGFDRAGFKCVSAVELDDHARASHELNFGNKDKDVSYRAYKDIVQTTPREAVSHMRNTSPEKAIDVVIGGPPCQAFSRLGRAALWDLAGKKHAHVDDPRATMYEHFLEYVAELQPLAFVMENVREISKFSGKNVAHEIAMTADQLGYETRYTILNATWYGVPQLRERLFIVGIAKELNYEPQFPEIKYDYKIPVGYSTSRAGTGKIDVLPPHDFYVDHFTRLEKLKPAITAEMAFEDLPIIKEHLDGRTGKGVPRKVDLEKEYRTGICNEFVQEMRCWPGFKSGSCSTGHVIRYTPRDYETFRRMPHGGMYPEALATAENIFQERIALKEKELGLKIEPESDLWNSIKKETVPPYKANRYPNKFRKMWPNHPARTLPAHIGKDSYSHIHFDSEQARCISLREAARLQSFPDAFKLAGSMNTQLKQIGNAVPPLLSYAVAKTLRSTLDGTINRKPPKNNEEQLGFQFTD
ncbi:DNA cytosine methyltransferase [Peribacillus frigoritolerans]|uniref:DNA cytosine methyltransferase n=1 Tax=Peribacillus frigoritolerans TaxID=450367 RepID=UPI002E1AD9A8|nr:DNA cytosine methyltransferase [Peribacillus frigoritolerans]